MVIEDLHFPEDPKQAIVNGFRRAELELLNELKKGAKDKNHVKDRSGSCALFVMMVNKRCYVANVGDSRAILSSHNGNIIYNVTKDHKPNMNTEKERIEMSGGKVY